MNTINLGQNTLGVKAAAARYFNKPTYQLTLSECAVIAAITQNPAGNNPISYPENNKRRRDKALNNMLDMEYITQAEYDEAWQMMSIAELLQLICRKKIIRFIHTL